MKHYFFGLYKLGGQWFLDEGRFIDSLIVVALWLIVIRLFVWG